MAEKQPKRERHDSTIDTLLMCPICQGQINGASLTTCGHRFCSRCIRQWLRNKTNCPTCRRDIRASNLVEDKNFDELVEVLLNKKKMEQQQQQQQQQQQASGQADVANQLYREMQNQNRVIVNLKDNLLEEKIKEIRRLEAAKDELTATNERLKRENDGLKSQINDELPRLRETQRELQGKVDRKRAKKQLLIMQITDLENRLTSTKTMCQNSETQKKTLKQSYDQKVEELQNAKKLLDRSREENKVLQVKIRSCEDASTLLQSDREKIVKEKAQLVELFGQLLHQKQENDKEVESLRQQCVEYQQQVLQLQMYESMYWETCQQMKELNENTLPIKDTTIIELQSQNATLFDQLAYFRENTILTQEHEKILNSKLESKENELRNFYDNEYGSKVRRTESMNETLQNRVETLENELKYRDEVGDELKKATRSYKSLVKEKEDFRDEINKKDKEIERLQHELARSKARTYELEKKISLSNERVKNVRAGKEDKLIK